MPIINCPIEGCDYNTGDVETSVAVCLLNIHGSIHKNDSNSTVDQKQKPPKLERPSIGLESSEETWNAFMMRWKMFTESSVLSADESKRQLFHCCEDDLGDKVLKGHPQALSGSVEALMDVIKRLAVIPVAVSVRRADLLGTRQDHCESIRSFYAKLQGKAATCNYTMVCSKQDCDQINNFTEVMVKDVLVAGLVDDEIKKETLGWSQLDEKNIEETVSFIEGKEMARDALMKQTVNAGISTYRTNKKAGLPNQVPEKVECKECGNPTDRYIWSKRGKKIECSLCGSCFKKSKQKKNRSARRTKEDDEASALMIGSISTPGPANAQLSKGQKRQTAAARGIEVLLDHFIFDSNDGWKKSESSKHPTLQLHMSTSEDDYVTLDAECPKIKPTTITAVSDTGAQSCLWGLDEFLRCGFKTSDLIPVKRSMVAANQEKIQISGAVFIRLSGKDALGNIHVAPVLVYISPSTKRFYLSRDALVQLGVISKNFPQVGGALEVSAMEHATSECGCYTRVLPPAKPDRLPFECSPQNNEKMKEWLLQRFAASTFNKCPHQQLKGMTGPEIKIHIDPNAKPVAVSTPATVPAHWQEQVKQSIDTDDDLGVLEKPPIGTPTTWVHRMVLIRKPDGTFRRAVDMSPLNKHCVRETHNVIPPFQQARNIPPNTWKSVTDAWNGYHSIPLREEDRHLTTFLTPWGRYRYKVAPQGFLASGDGYARRYDEIIAEVQRKTKCVDDTAMWDTDLETHWWRMLEFLELVGRNGIVLNPQKFQFAEREIDFAGFRITEKNIKPLEKYTDAIRNFPVPKKITDVRSWFGLVHQVSNYGQLTNIMAPFKPLLSPKTKFYWNEALNEAFVKSKDQIIQAISQGVEIFDVNRRTCIRPDWSKVGIGYFLSQKYCQCESTSPGCCIDGWRVAMAGSRFLKPCETRYAAVEGEALAIQWALEQTKYFTLGCDNLLVTTDHKPLVKLFGDRLLDEITNPRLFRLKQKTLLWRFDIEYQAGKQNHGADALSRNPVDGSDADEISSITLGECLSGIRVHDSELATIASLSDDDKVMAVSWGRVKEETVKDSELRLLMELVQSGFPESRKEMPAEVDAYWTVRNNLYVVNGVLLKMPAEEITETPILNDETLQISEDGEKVRVIIPTSLRPEVLNSLHAAHQGVSSMNERARCSVYWPGITTAIQATRDRCSQCNRNAPSQPRSPPFPPHVPTTPFECIACDYFHFKGFYYFVAADRLSGWTEQYQIKVGTKEAGASGLCRALRRLFVTFGTPVEISSDGGPEFSSKETEEFLKRWGIRHRTSSVALPASNGRAEVAVKSVKRLLMNNVASNGDLNTDRMVRALLMQRNTPDADCKLSPAQVLFGRPLRDTLPYISKKVMAFNNPDIAPQWRDAWRLKEEALKSRYVKTLEDLNHRSRSLNPLKVGDLVFVQNQTGRFPNKWDKSGIIVEVRNYNQYVVKIHGTGRLTLRNRKFLRQFTSHVESPMNTICIPTSSSPVAQQVQQTISNPAVSNEGQGQVQDSQPDIPESEIIADPVESTIQDHEPVVENDNSTQLPNRRLTTSKGSRMLKCLETYNKPGRLEEVSPQQNELPYPEADNERSNTVGQLRRSSRKKTATKYFGSTA